MLLVHTNSTSPQNPIGDAISPVTLTMPMMTKATADKRFRGRGNNEVQTEGVPKITTNAGIMDFMMLMEEIRITSW